MTPTNRFNVDRAMSEISLDEAAARSGITLDAKGPGSEVRLDCPFGCAGDHTGRREISVNTEHPAKLWKCHSYGCEMRGNLLGLMHGWIAGTRWSGERLHGEEFKRVRDVLAGSPPDNRSPAAQPLESPKPETQVQTAEPRRNVPILESPDDRIRGLMEPPLYEKFVHEIDEMAPAASAYIRRHPCLTSSAMEKWRVGVMPKDAGSDKRGFSLRGAVVYTFFSDQGEVLGFVGRDTEYERKDRAFAALSDDERRGKTPPGKHRFPKNFHRGIELYGQHRDRLKEPGYAEVIARYGLILVEGFNDVIALDNFGMPALGICSNRITAEQVEKVTRWARQLSAGKVALLFDCDGMGEAGAQNAAWRLLEEGLDVRLGWSQAMHGGEFQGRQPESLTEEELRERILPTLERNRGVRIVAQRSIAR